MAAMIAVSDSDSRGIVVNEGQEGGTEAGGDSQSMTAAEFSNQFLCLSHTGVCNSGVNVALSEGIKDGRLALNMEWVRRRGIAESGRDIEL